MPLLSHLHENELCQILIWNMETFNDKNISDFNKEEIEDMIFILCL